MLTFTLIKEKRLIVISRNGKQFASGLVFNVAHASQIKQKFEAWDKQGWPYEPKGL